MSLGQGLITLRALSQQIHKSYVIVSILIVANVNKDIGELPNDQVFTLSITYGYIELLQKKLTERSIHTYIACRCDRGLIGNETMTKTVSFVLF